jgi:predicted ATPase
MSKIKIKNFGPIKEGYTDENGWIEIKKVTMFIGNQGSGKSTVAKLISTCSWMEKAMYRGDFNEKDLSVYNRFKKHCSYQNIGNYFKNDSIIEYEGKAFSIHYKNGNLTVKKTKEKEYSFPKIMYVPSERNFVSSVTNVRNLKGLPLTIYTFSDEFLNAIENLNGKLDLPINKTKFEYQKLNKTSYIIGDDYKIRLSEASSGFQSFVPLFLVTRFLTSSINKESNLSVKDISIDEEKRIKKEIEKIYANEKLSESVKKLMLEHLSSRFKYSCFINIVEEPELNLFPNSQRNMLNSLLRFANLHEGNKLIMTTHSPYILNYLTLNVKTHLILNKPNYHTLKDELNPKLCKIVPLVSAVKPNDLVIYELNDFGNIVKLGDYKGLPSDENYLNNGLAESNELFAQLLEIEDLCR